jgi:hypothetical protein
MLEPPKLPRKNTLADESGKARFQFQCHKAARGLARNHGPRNRLALLQVRVQAQLKTLKPPLTPTATRVPTRQRPNPETNSHAIYNDHPNPRSRGEKIPQLEPAASAMAEYDERYEGNGDHAAASTGGSPSAGAKPPGFSDYVDGRPAQPQVGSSARVSPVH